MCVCVNDTKILVCEEQGEGTVILQASFHLHIIYILICGGD